MSYNPFTDPDVLKRLKKSPVEWGDGAGYLQRLEMSPSHQQLMRYTWADDAERSVDKYAVCSTPSPSDAHHIEAAWMVELAEKLDDLAWGFNIKATRRGKRWCIYITPRTGSREVWSCGAPAMIRALALALDWLEGEKT